MFIILQLCAYRTCNITVCVHVQCNICVWLGLSLSFQSSVFLFSPLITDLFLKFMGELYPQQAFTHNIKEKSGIHVLSSNRCYMYGSPTEDVHTDMKAPLIVKDLLKANWYMCGFNCDSCPILRLEDFLTDDIMALLIIINKNVIGIYTKKHLNHFLLNCLDVPIKNHGIYFLMYLMLCKWYVKSWITKFSNV